MNQRSQLALPLLNLTSPNNKILFILYKSSSLICFISGGSVYCEVLPALQVSKRFGIKILFWHSKWANNNSFLISCLIKGDRIGTVLAKIDRVFKIYFIASNESRRIQLQLATNRIKIRPLEPEIQPGKDGQRHYAGPITSRDVIGMPPKSISLVTLYNCFLTIH